MSSLPENEAALDELFEELRGRLERGEAVDLKARAAAAGVAEDEARRLLELARDMVGPGSGAGFPRVPGFELLGVLGRGATSTVYLARQTSMSGRRVALKVLVAGLFGGRHARERFLAEARALARVEHPGIVRIFEVVDTPEVLAYAMEWVRGRSLAAPELGELAPARSEESNARVPRVLRLGMQIADALAAVHAAGLLHRDVKPSNILLREDGRALLSDFGLVKDPEASLGTRQGDFLGTLSFAAPEQIRGEAVDGRADVYGLAATLYRVLTGRPPIEASSVVGVLEAHGRGGVPPLRAADPRLPRDLETVLAKALESEPAARYPGAREFGEDLRRVLALQPIAARPAGWISRGRKLVRRQRRVLAGALVGLALALAAAGLQRGLEDRRRGLERRAGELRRAAQLELIERGPFQRLRTLSFLGDAERRALLLEVVRPVAAGLEEGVATGAADRGARIERAVLELARAELVGDAAARGRAARSLADLGCPRTVALLGEGAPGRPADWTAPSTEELRALGLLAYVLGDAELAVEAFGAFEERGPQDPFVSALLARLFLDDQRPERAYPRALRAARAFPESGALLVLAANTALACGDASVAAGLLERAREARRPAGDFALQIASAALDWVRAGDRPQEHEMGTLWNALACEARGELEVALAAYVNLAAFDGENATLLRALLRASRRWWARKTPQERRRLWLDELEGSVSSVGSLSGLLTWVRRARAALRERLGPLPAPVFTVDADPLVFDPALTRDEFAPDSIDALAERCNLPRVDLPAVMDWPREAKAELVGAWLGSEDAGGPRRAEELLRARGALFPEDRPLFARRDPLPSPPAAAARSLEDPVHLGGEFFARPLCPVADLDGDGMGDVLFATALPGRAGGQVHGVRASSGATGRTLYTVTGEAATWDAFGHSLVALPDVDGDGVGDWASSGEDTGGGFVYVASGADGHRLAFLRAAGGDRVAGLACLVDGAGGPPRLALGFGTASGALPQGGRVDVLGLDGRRAYSVDGLAAGGRLGGYLAAVGDLDGDGAADLAAGTSPTSDEGAYLLFLSGRDGRGIDTLGGAGRDLGWRARGEPAGDLDGDGVPDVALGFWPRSEAERPLGHALVVSGRTRAELLHLRGDVPFQNFGEDVHTLGDLDGDGRPETAVSSWSTRSVRPPRVEVFDADGVLLAAFPSWWRLRRLPCDDPDRPPRLLAVRLGSWSRYDEGGLGGRGEAVVFDWVAPGEGAR